MTADPGRSEFEADTAVVAGDGGWEGRINPRWNVGANPNGGYTLAMGARALLGASGRADPLSLTAHYVRPPVAGPVTIVPEVVRAGRRYATVAGRMVQGDREALRLLGAFGDLAASEGPTRLGAVAPAVRPPEDCVAMWAVGDETTGVTVPEVARRYELRLDPDCQWVRARRQPFDVGAAGRPAQDGPGPERTGEGGPAQDGTGVEGPLEARGWIRFADGTEPSVLGLLAMVDAFPPTVIGSIDVGWIPTVELTAHVRGRPAPGWILGVFRTRWLLDGLLDQDGELWDSTGTLVAMCRQLAIALPRR